MLPTLKEVLEQRARLVADIIAITMANKVSEQIIESELLKDVAKSSEQSKKEIKE